MDIPAEILEGIKCSSCELYLSRGPVYLQHDGAAACGRCYTSKRPAARNTPYEVAARLLNLKFPCKYRQFGCLETIPYLEPDNVIEHEEVCEHRQYVCPVLGCDWLGPRASMMAAHCRNQHPDIVRVICAECAVEVTVFLYRGEDGWRCERCVPARRPCKNRRHVCTYTDIDNKCTKHEDLLCQQRNECFICDVSVSRGSLSAHYSFMHQDITHRAGSTWRQTQTGGWRFCLVPSVAGTAVCEYRLLDSVFDMSVYTPVSSERLSEFRCEVRLTDPATGHARTFTSDIKYDEEFDWRIKVKKEEFPWLNTVLEVCVDITKAGS